jgi:hypothetical protein
LCNWPICGRNTEGADTARREKKGKDQWGREMEQIDFKGLTQDEVLGQTGLIKQLTGKIPERAPESEMGLDLGYEKHEPAGDSRNGQTEKAVLTGDQEAAIRIPRDRNGTFQPQIIPKYQKRVPLFNDQILSMYSIGMTDREIKAHEGGSVAVPHQPGNGGGYGRGQGEAEAAAGKILGRHVFGCDPGEGGGGKLHGKRIGGPGSKS